MILRRAVNKQAAWNSASINITGNYDPVMTIYDHHQSTIVKLNRNGTVDWPEGLRVDDASDAFCNAMLFGGAQCDGLEKAVRQKIVACVFEHLQGLAELNGPLSANDLTNEQECYKIVARLKGTE